MAETVAELRRQLVAGSLPSGSKMNADALWTAGHKPGEFFNETGLLDTDKLTAAVRETHEALGVRFGPDPVTDSGKGSGLGLKGEPATLASEARKRQR